MPPLKPKPLYRSLTFWSGILVMAFIGWAWWKSWEWHADVEWGRWTVRQHWGMVELQRDDDHSSGLAAFTAPLASLSTQLGSELSWHRLAGPHFIDQQDVAGRDLDPESWRQIKVKSVREYHEILLLRRPDILSILAVPHSILLLTFAIPWFGLLLWRGRRIRRAGLSDPV